MISAIEFQFIFWPFLAVVAALGLFALLSPRYFRRFAVHCSKWVDTEKALATMNKRVDVDHDILRHCRALGAAVLSAAALLAYLSLAYGAFR